MSTGGGRFVRGMYLPRDALRDGYPFDLPVISRILEPRGISFPAGATFLVGENGSGKSTLVEALAVAVGLNAEGGSQNHRFSTRATESELGSAVTVITDGRTPRSRFFLRAESFYNVATAAEEIGVDTVGGVSPHERSHGESFVDLMRHRFFPGGLYLMDEPEAALSPQGCLAVVALMAELVADGSQLIIATHSPILLALPGARIYEIDDDGEIDVVGYDEALPVRMTRDFLADPARYLRHLGVPGAAPYQTRDS
ncbi:AAA family ATPase [Gordonia sp. VNK1]|uniref:AAA family ATPase n=1 Tax=Gordonia oleivorans TaxID=3156618 RepID=UPI0032B5F242